jgi:YrbI family 3-deoxy-D-manno-octulosonate 8-phosphate phosphatase
MLFMDVDGVLTDGGMYYSESGEAMKKFNTRDGMGIQIARERGIIPVILTKEESLIVRRRAEKLRITEVHTGVEDKLAKAREILARYHLGFGDAAFVGDDINDLPLLREARVSFCPADAVEEVKKSVTIVCRKRGGEGVIREVVDSLLTGPRSPS